MKSAYWGFGLIIFGILIVVLLMLFFSYSGTDESDYYNLKEATEGAMLNSVDYEKLKNTGKLSIKKEEFMAEFIRRFSENTKNSKNYKIDFYEFYENPPKVSIKISTSTGREMNFTSDIGIVNKISAILEVNGRNTDINDISAQPFFIGSNSYVYTGKMTWDFWVNTAYNFKNISCKVENDYVLCKNSKGEYKNIYLNNNKVLRSDLLKSRTYSFKS